MYLLISFTSRLCAVLPALAFMVVFQPAANADYRLKDEQFSIALTGDSIITRKLSVYDEPQFLAMIELIRGADVAFTNLEVLFHDYESYPMAVSGGTWMRAAPELAEELVWAGFDLVSRANNHTGDYGVAGLRSTTNYVRKVGLVDAGAGESLAEAREARFIETSKARVALVSLSSTYAKHMEAGASRDNVPARPGLNPLRYETVYQLRPGEFENLKTVAATLGEFTDKDGNPKGFDESAPNLMEAFDLNFEISDSTGVRTSANQADLEAIAAVVENAKRLADYVIVSIHAHEGPNRKEPAEFIQQFARSIVKSGADVVVGHGPHVLRGLEIYEGKPIFYSLGDFIFQNETLLRLPHDNYARYDLGESSHVADFNDRRYKNDTSGFPALPEVWESVIAVPVFENHQLIELAIHPITLGYGLPRQVRGRPMLANPDLGKKIIEDLRARSNGYGTEIVERDGIGYVRLDIEK